MDRTLTAPYFFPSALQLLCDAQGLSKSKLARLADLTPSFVSRLISDDPVQQRMPSRKTVQRLADALQLELGAQERDRLFVSAGFLPEVTLVNVPEFEAFRRIYARSAPHIQDALSLFLQGAVLYAEHQEQKQLAATEHARSAIPLKPMLRVLPAQPALTWRCGCGHLERSHNDSGQCTAESDPHGEGYRPCGCTSFRPSKPEYE